MTDTAGLIEMVGKLTGPSREVDAAIVKVFCPDATVSTYIVGDDGDVVFHANALGIANKATVPLYTASVDAALAFAERVLPGALFEMCSDKDGKWEAGYIPPGSDYGFFQIKPTLPLAIILATLRALESPHG